MSAFNSPLSITLTHSYQLATNLNGRFEIRSDKSSESNGLNQDSGTLAALYSF